MKFKLTLVLLLLGASLSAASLQITNPPGKVALAWDSSTSTNVTGYKVYWGVGARSYTNSVDVGLTNQCLITPLVRGTKYYLAATACAVDQYGDTVESTWSNEVTFTPMAPPAAPTLRITNALVAMTIQTAPSVTGPWTAYASLGTDNLPSPTFFRVAITAPPPEPQQIKPLFRSPKRNAI